MRAEAWIFGLVAGFFATTTVVYWFVAEEPAGTTALALSAGLMGLMTFYFWHTSQHMPSRLEDRKDAEIADGAGELGFFSPHSWWPLYCALALAVCVLGVVFGWWLFIIGVGVGALALSGLVFEYYRGEHAH